MNHLKLFEDFTDYSEYRTAIIAVSNPLGQILVLQRGSTAPWMPNAWSLVGGGLDADETPMDAVVRECQEEVGFTPHNVSFVRAIKTPDIGEIFYFVGDSVGAEVTLDWENQAYRFITEQELDDLEFVPYVKEFLRELL